MRRTSRFAFVSVIVTYVLFICALGPVFLSKHDKEVSSNAELAQARRLVQLSKGCQILFPHQSHGANASLWHLKVKDAPMGLAIDGKHRFGFCWNNKAASTSLGSWMVEVTNTSKYLQTQGYHKILSSMRPQSLTELEKFVINGHLFIVVRHPFARVVSAFNDRIIGDPQSYQSRKFVPLIKKKLELQLNPKRALQFRHFVAYLLSTPTRLYDPHWSPMWLHCAPCQIPYRQIVKVETLVQDFHFLQERIPNFPHHALPFLHQSQRGTEKETIRKHWQELNGLEKATFFKIYQNDFLLFDYDVHEFE